MTRASRCKSWFLRRAPRTVDTKRKTARANPSAGRRPSAVLHEGQRSKRDRREAWPPATAQHDPHTLKGKKPHERPPEIGLVNVSATGKETFAGSTGQGRTSRKGVLKRKSQALKLAGTEQQKVSIMWTCPTRQPTTQEKSGTPQANKGDQR
jgi:hypothetical protein